MLIKFQRKVGNASVGELLQAGNGGRPGGLPGNVGRVVQRLPRSQAEEEMGKDASKDSLLARPDRRASSVVDTSGHGAVSRYGSVFRMSPDGPPTLRPPVVQRKPLPGAEDIKQEIRRNGMESTRKTVETLFHRLHSTRRLRTQSGSNFEDVQTAMAAVFPAGYFNGRMYRLIRDQSLGDKESKGKQEDKEEEGSEENKGQIRAADWKNIEKLATEQAPQLAGECAAAKELIEAVMGPEAGPEIAATFLKIQGRLSEFKRDNYMVNYDNVSDATGMGGATVAGSGSIELALFFVRNFASKSNQLKRILIHEGAHEIDPAIRDLGYSGSPGFEAMTKKDKACNAAHYEDVAARLLGVSEYKGMTFVPRGEVLADVKDLFDLRVAKACGGLEHLWRLALTAQDWLNDKETVPRPEDNEERAAFKRDLAEQIKRGFWLPREGSPRVLTAVDRSLIFTTATVLEKAIGKARRLGKAKSLAVFQKAAVMSPHDIGGRMIEKAKGLSSNPEESAARHDDLVSFYRWFNKGQSPYD